MPSTRVVVGLLPETSRIGTTKHSKQIKEYNMSKKYRRIVRMTATLATTGVLLQTGGCMTDETISGLLVSVLGSLVQSLVLGGFNLV